MVNTTNASVSAAGNTSNADFDPYYSASPSKENYTGIVFSSSGKITMKYTHSATNSTPAKQLPIISSLV